MRLSRKQRLSNNGDLALHSSNCSGTGLNLKVCWSTDEIKSHLPGLIYSMTTILYFFELNSRVMIASRQKFIVNSIKSMH